MNLFLSHWPRRSQVIYNATKDIFEGILIPKSHGLIKENLRGEITSVYFSGKSFVQWPPEVLKLPELQLVADKLLKLGLGNFTSLSVKAGKIDSFYYFCPVNKRLPSVQYQSQACDKAIRLEHKFNVCDDRSFVYYHLPSKNNKDHIPYECLNGSEQANLTRMLGQLPADVFCRMYSPKDIGQCFVFSSPGGWTEHRTL